MTPIESALRAADFHVPDAAKVSAIEDAIAAGQMTAAQVFTQMRQLIAAQAAELARLSAELHDQRWQHAQELKRAEQAERERDALRLVVDELRGLLVEVRNQRFFILHCPDGFLGRIDAALTRNLRK